MNAFLPAGIESLFCLLKSTRQSMHGASEGGANSLLSTSMCSFSKYHKDEEVLAPLSNSEGQEHLVSVPRCRS